MHIDSFMPLLSNMHMHMHMIHMYDNHNIGCIINTAYTYGRITYCWHEWSMYNQYLQWIASK